MSYERLTVARSLLMIPKKTHQDPLLSGFLVVFFGLHLPVVE
jgi:hypothetical protein